MKFVLSQENLAKSLSFLNHVVSSKPTLPVLGNILVEVQKGNLRFLSTNLETAVIIKTQAKLVKEGKVTFPAKVAQEFVSQLPKGEVGVELTDSHLTFSSGKFKATLTTIPAEEFPGIPEPEEKGAFLMDTEEFSLALSQVTFAAAQDEGRPVLTGVLWQKAGDTLTLIATDGYRLSFRKTTVPKTTGDFSLLVPAKTLFEVVRLLSEEKVQDEKLKVFYKEGQNQIGFESQGIRLVSRIIEGQFPDWERIVPKEFQIRCTLDKDELLQAVKIASVFARDAGNIVKMTIGGSSLTIRANSAQIGENESNISAKVEGGEGEIAFNYRYVIDALSAITTEKVIFEMIGALNPAVFRPHGKELEDFYHIVMPVRVQA